MVTSVEPPDGPATVRADLERPSRSGSTTRGGSTQRAE